MNKATRKESKNPMQELANDQYGAWKRSIEETIIERVHLQRDSIFCLITDLCVIYLEECHAGDGKYVLKTLYSDEDLEHLPTTEQIKDLQNNKRLDIDAWLPIITPIAAAEGETEMTTPSDNPLQGLYVAARKITSDEWSLRNDSTQTISYGLTLLVMCDRVIKENVWTAETCTLLNKVEDCIRDLFRFGGSSGANLRHNVRNKAAEIKTGIQYKGAGKKQKETYLKKDQPLIDFILKKDKEGKFKALAGKEQGTLATKIGKLIERHNGKQEEKHPDRAQEITSQSQDSLKNKLEKYFLLKKGEKLPKPLSLCYCETQG